VLAPVTSQLSPINVPSSFSASQSSVTGIIAHSP
jgi:hypothetical protein